MRIIRAEIRHDKQLRSSELKNRYFSSSKKSLNIDGITHYRVANIRLTKVCLIFTSIWISAFTESSETQLPTGYPVHYPVVCKATNSRRHTALKFHLQYVKQVVLVTEKVLKLN